ncbi:MAG: D-alanyl-D-alanine carboxypeptidase family protein [Myxococcales bacterium]|nr:D-alanyl-D-alanine carboxypeptidase family protein [Myxococcales bacterium]
MTADDFEPGDEPAGEPSSSTESQFEPAPSVAPTPRQPWTSRRTLGLSAAFVAILAVIALDVRSILNTRKTGVVIPPSTPSANPPTESPAPVESAEVPSVPSEPSLSKFEPVDDGDDEPPTDERAKPKPDKPARAGTVREAAARTCSTSSVDGLSRQIVIQARCIDGRAFASVPSRPNLVTARNVFLYLHAPARDHLVKALDANKTKKMTVNSALRTVAQQYLLWRWAAGQRCGIKLATPPGESNHETGLALDIAEAGAWRSALEAHEFRWLGSIDRVHFDYKGPDAASRSSVDVRAFQQLWNRNHADDPIPETGRYAPATQERLEKSPSAGFPLGPRCGKVGARDNATHADRDSKQPKQRG